MKRRHFLTATAAATAGTTIPRLPAEPEGSPAAQIGVSIASYGQRWGARKTPAGDGWRDALDVLEHCRTLGATCLQIGVAGWEADFAARVRDRREAAGIALEGQITLPESPVDIGRFAGAVRAAREAGAVILRTVCLGGRRYETFARLDDWKQFATRSRERLALAEPVMRAQNAILAVENHKDWRTEEFVSLIEHFDSEHIRVNYDFGNNVALLESPEEMAEALSPWIVTTHLKDMATMRSEEGFLLSEVPLGNGMLDLPRIIAACRKHRPQAHLNLEMITRDPLRIPCLLGNFWTTMPGVPAGDLAGALQRVEKSASSALPKTSGLTAGERIAAEEANVRASFRYAKQSLRI